MPMKANAEAFIENDTITICVQISALADVVEGWWTSGNSGTRYKVTNPESFAKEVVRALNDEDEQGNTMIYDMFDNAFENAINQGADGIEEHGEQEH